jgi:glycosyltransferase involved in cell wall biosynthesis
MPLRRRSVASRSEIHQFVPSLGFRDATGNTTLEMQRAFAEGGYPGDLWAISMHREVEGRAKLYPGYAKYAKRPGHRALLYQCGTGAEEMVNFLLDRPEKKFIYYHNMTPAHFFAPYDPAAAAQMNAGRAELVRVCKNIELALTNSAYSGRELRELGVDDVRVVPPYLGVHKAASRSYLARLKRGKQGIDVLFCGRVAPNKGHIHLLRAFAALRAGCEARSRLFIVGGFGPHLYMSTIQAMRRKIGDEGVVLTGSVTEGALQAHYEAADVFLCLSEHEGFGAPLVEAMRSGLPVIAYDEGAVAETLGGAGILVKTLDPYVIAETIYRVASDEALRSSLIERQYERAKELEDFPRDERIVAAARQVLGE